MTRENGTDLDLRYRRRTMNPPDASSGRWTVSMTMVPTTTRFTILHTLSASSSDFGATEMHLSCEFGWLRDQTV